MSFRREGNDGSLLGILMKRRIRDLLSDDIPENEAKLLCNGRFSCTVCSNYPIFDTVNMLAAHRKGKKHQHYQQIHDAKEKEVEYLLRQRQQAEILEYGKTSIREKSTSKFSSLSSPYSSCRKKSHSKAGDRKPRLDLTSDQSQPTSSDSTCRNSHSHWREMCKQQTHGPVSHDRQLKKVFSPKAMHPGPGNVRVTPYRSKAPNRAFCTEIRSSRSSGSEIESKKLSASHERGKGSSFSEQEDASRVSGFCASLTCATTDSDSGDINSRMGSSMNSTHSATLVQRHSCHSGGCDNHQSAQSSLHQKVQKNTERNQELAAKYRLLQGSGWKKDWDGKWIKDEEAEFDSDEEPPDLP